MYTKRKEETQRAQLVYPATQTVIFNDLQTEASVIGNVTRCAQIDLAILSVIPMAAVLG
jgi:hypothetical protein